MNERSSNNTLLCLGYGYTARALAARLTAQGWTVIGTTRDMHAGEPPHSEPDARRIFTWRGPQDNDRLPLGGVTHVLHSIAPDAEGDPVFTALGAQLSTLPSLKWMGYLSTTAVYGDHDGAWVDEDTPVTPSSRRGAWRAQAEAHWQSLLPGLPLHIFRLAGIYGPGRGPFAKLMEGRARRIVKPGQVFSRIHVEDIATTLEASIQRPRPGAIYNVCDDDPAPPQDVLGYAAELLGLPIPAEVPFDEAAMSPMARSFYGENKRVRNDLLKQELGVQLRYYDYREGLKAVRDAENLQDFIPPLEPPGV